MVVQPDVSLTMNITLLRFHPHFHSSEVHHSHELNSEKFLNFKRRNVHMCSQIHTVASTCSHLCQVVMENTIGLPVRLAAISSAV